ncbi:MAG: phosphomannomutase, partial [Candidatus Krumholzibacteria bacterium]|nr:phosphomannomutase [Candidatus Krumholzibacteria bacterium]
DSGMLPWLYVLQEMAATGQSLAALVGAMQAAYPASGEINRRLADPAAAMARVEARYAGSALRLDRTDGLSCEFADWRFNLRQSNTEPLLRLNVESRADRELLQARTRDILNLVDG